MAPQLVVRDVADFEVRLTRLRDLLQKVETVTDARVGADIAASLRTWAERAHLSLDSVNEAVRVMLEYQRRGGRLLASTPSPSKRGRPRRNIPDVGGNRS
jgi:hypothetical protein